MNHLKILSSIILIAVSFYSKNQALAQEIGVSASFFLPKNGYFSAPISPISFRGFGYGITDMLSIETGITLYRMSGLNIKDLPFKSKKPLVGPTFTLMIPLEAVVEVGNQRHIVSIKGGGFVFYSFDQKINYGNLDRALRNFEGWTVINSDFNTDSNIGMGIHFGMEYTYYLTQALGISLGGIYYIGESPIELNGSYSGGSPAIPITTVPANFPNGKVDFTGFEISVGLIFATN